MCIQLCSLSLKCSDSYTVTLSIPEMCSLPLFHKFQVCALSVIAVGAVEAVTSQWSFGTWRGLPERTLWQSV